MRYYKTVFAACRDNVAGAVTADVGEREDKDTGEWTLDSERWNWDEDTGVDFVPSTSRKIRNRVPPGTLLDVYVYGWYEGERQLLTNLAIRRVLYGPDNSHCGWVVEG